MIPASEDPTQCKHPIRRRFIVVLIAGLALGVFVYLPTARREFRRYRERKPYIDELKELGLLPLPVPVEELEFRKSRGGNPFLANETFLTLSENQYSDWVKSLEAKGLKSFERSGNTYVRPPESGTGRFGMIITTRFGDGKYRLAWGMWDGMNLVPIPSPGYPGPV